MSDAEINNSQPKYKNINKYGGSKNKFIVRKTNDKAAKSPDLPIFLLLDTSAVKKIQTLYSHVGMQVILHNFDIVVPFSRTFDLIDCMNF